MTVSPVAHTATSLSTLVLLIKFYATLMKQGGARFRAGSRPPEDANAFPDLVKSLKATTVKQTFGVSAEGAEASEKELKARMADVRWQRIVSNDLENIPLGLIIAWTSLPTAWSPLLHALLVSLFAAARVGHTIAYAKALQPHRAATWAAGIVSVLGLCLNGVAGLVLGSGVSA
ncbi:hypothetical protein BCR33DRAFT_711305 [Rhizoclosmatium globosum]|uniref:Microsomal glutathione S-transferase 1 n=1 Tax=Rhizoclosmatium globosum TaxID=329046 RepID=A0A1Y2D2U2_9FUNG|nr:hypothetical protein BCR33DRAFT_711305 [Rhizoclosmatium globosum]|eukprot:ORY52885.1 hypothetical protein BCR33DRAFT_711305 [Rhizoclosmatium globosum]